VYEWDCGLFGSPLDTEWESGWIGKLVGQGSPCMAVDGDETWAGGDRRRWRGRVVLSGGANLREGQGALAVLTRVVV
jgi:hypothetical protein